LLAARDRALQELLVSKERLGLTRDEEAPR
jgi:hypothetical protein